MIVVYPEYSEKSDIYENSSIKQEIKDLWDKLPIFRNSMDDVPTIHIPFKKELIKDINSVLKNGVLVMSIEIKPSVINSIHIVKYNFYIIQPNTNKKEVLTLSRTVKTSELHTLGDLIKLEFIEFLIKGGLKEYE